MNYLAHLSVKQRISIAAVAVLVAAGMFAFVRHQREADFRPLFTGVPAEDAAAIVQKLKETGVEYRLAENGTVSVPSARLPELRLVMAAAGLPKTGRMGFELFDKTNLGATEFTEHINYRRALEGELERSVMSLAEVEQARVHLTFPKDSVFLDAQQPAKASVMVKVRPGARLAKQNVQAINHLIASAVEGLSPDNVSVLDMNGNLLGRPKSAAELDSPELTETGLEYRRKVEGDLLAKINNALEPLLGPDRFRAGVSVECDFSGAEQSEELFDPTRSVMLSSQRSEDTTLGATAAGMPGTPSTLPRPVSRPSAGSKGLSRVTENITYQTSRTVTKTRLPAGAIRRMSLAVLVDQDLSWQRDRTGVKRVLIPPSAEKLKAIRDLVAGITGFDEKRGDQIAVETLPFESTLSTEPPRPDVPATPPASDLRHMDQRIWIGAGIVVGVLLLLAVFVLRSRRRATVTVSAPAELPAAVPGDVPAPTSAAGPPAVQAAEVEAPATEEPEEQLAALDRPAQTPEEDLAARLAARDVLEQQLEAQALKSLTLAPVITKTGEILARHLREKIGKNPEVSAQVLRTWIRDEEA
jgi:flagellar M-ring protein FliF